MGHTISYEFLNVAGDQIGSVWGSIVLQDAPKMKPKTATSYALRGLYKLAILRQSIQPVSGTVKSRDPADVQEGVYPLSAADNDYQVYLARDSERKAKAHRAGKDYRPKPYRGVLIYNDDTHLPKGEEDPHHDTFFYSGLSEITEVKVDGVSVSVGEIRAYIEKGSAKLGKHKGSEAYDEARQAVVEAWLPQLKVAEPIPA